MPAPLIHALRVLAIGIHVHNKLPQPPVKKPDFPLETDALIDYYYKKKARQRP